MKENRFLWEDWMFSDDEEERTDPHTGFVYGKEYKLRYSGEFCHFAPRTFSPSRDADYSEPFNYVGSVLTHSGRRAIFYGSDGYIMFGVDQKNYIVGEDALAIDVNEWLLKTWRSIGIDRPDNHEYLCNKIVEYVADPDNYNDSDFAIAFRRTMENTNLN